MNELLSGLAFSITVFLGFVVWKSKVFKLANKLFGFFCLVLAGQIVINYFSIALLEEEVSIWFIRGVMALAVLVCYALVLFAASFPEDRISWNKKTVGLSIVTVLVAVICMTPLVFSGVSYAGDTPVPTPGPAIVVFAFTVLSLIVLAAVILVRKALRVHGLKRLYLYYVISGLVLSYGVLFIFSFIFVVLLQRSEFVQYTPLFYLPFVCITAYSLIRYRFFNIRSVISESFKYLVTFALTVAIYLCLLFIGRGLFIIEHGWSEQTITVVMVVLVAITMEPLRRLLYRAVGSVFISKKESQKMRLAMHSSVQFESLLGSTLTSLKNVLHVQAGNFIYLDPRSHSWQSIVTDSGLILDPDSLVIKYLLQRPELIITEELSYASEEMSEQQQQSIQNIQKELEDKGIGMVVPIGEPGELFGLFTFGNKDKKEAYTEDNVVYMKALLPNLAGAIMNALLYRQAVERIGGAKKLMGEGE